MKRDMDLIRLVLMDAEEKDSVDLSAYSHKEIVYHKYLIIDAKLAHGDASRATDDEGNPEVYHAWVSVPTWEGHEFLDAARSESVWKDATGKIAKTGATVSFDVLKAVLVAITKESLGLT